MSVTDGIGQTPCSLEHYLVIDVIHSQLELLTLTVTNSQAR